ncbi:GreA/GreB family elongation factor [Polaribacter sp.]|nr:GreA/GreB family elongation factor [Polaribacter sp.]
MSIKKELLVTCFSFVAEREKTVQKTITSNQKALQSETKSSAGDKHETGRAMLQLEMEKAGQQLSSIHTMKLILKRIDVENSSKNARLGSLIQTNKGNYFLAISLGKCTIDQKEYFVISTSSPIGKQLLGKSNGDSFNFNAMNFQILEVK